MLCMMEPFDRPARHRAMRTPNRSPGVVLRALALVAVILLAATLLAACSGSAPAPPPTPAPVATLTPSPVGTSSSIGTQEQAVAAVQAQTPLFDGFGPKRKDMVGQAQWWEAQPQGGSTTPTGWTVTFTTGWGDCPAGCIDHHSWTWKAAADGTVTFVSEEGSVLTPEVLAGLHANAKGPGAGGRVTAGPTCPVERPGDPACAPRMVAGAVLIVRDGTGKEFARVATDQSGLFRFSLPAGDYTLEPQPVEGLMGTAAPMPFTVADGAVTWLDVAYDTGIR